MCGYRGKVPRSCRDYTAVALCVQCLAMVENWPDFSKDR